MSSRHCNDSYSYDNNTSYVGVVPEPSILLLWLAGAGTIYGVRRHRRRQAAKPRLANPRPVAAPVTNLKKH